MGLEWIMDPTAWAGLAMLIVLEIVLGIDNLIFIAILSEKLPVRQRPRARYTGLSLALLMRLLLLFSIKWVTTLNRPLFTIFSNEISWHDIVLIVGGLFLLFKGTWELHDRLEGYSHKTKGSAHAVFWQVIVQIVVLDAVFSLDSIITAVGLVKHLPVMMLAVIIAVGVMMIASNRLMDFVTRHPTVVILCLGFLLMIGFSLILEGFGFHIPKGYLYAAIGFSVLIELFNQVARKNSQKLLRPSSLRDSTAQAVLRMLGGRTIAEEVAATHEGMSEQTTSEEEIFAPEEREMIRQVLKLGGRNARAIMVPRPQMVWVDIDDPIDVILKEIEESSHAVFPVCQGDVDNVVGLLRSKDLLPQFAEKGFIDIRAAMKEPIFVVETMSVLKLIERFKGSITHMALVVDEHGTIEGLVTPADIFGAIAGELAGDEGDDEPLALQQNANCWIMDGQILIDEALRLLQIDSDPPGEGDYTTLAGFVLYQTGHIPKAGDVFEWQHWDFEVVSLEGRRIDRVKIKKNTTI